MTGVPEETKAFQSFLKVCSNANDDFDFQSSFTDLLDFSSPLIEEFFLNVEFNVNAFLKQILGRLEVSLLVNFLDLATSIQNFHVFALQNTDLFENFFLIANCPQSRRLYKTLLLEIPEFQPGSQVYEELMEWVSEVSLHQFDTYELLTELLNRSNIFFNHLFDMMLQINDFPSLRIKLIDGTVKNGFVKINLIDFNCFLDTIEFGLKTHYNSIFIQQIWTDYWTDQEEMIFDDVFLKFLQEIFGIYKCMRKQEEKCLDDILFLFDFCISRFIDVIPPEYTYKMIKYLGENSD